MFMKNIKDEVLTWNPFIIKKKEIALAPSQKGTYLVFFLFQSVIHTGDLSLRCHVDLEIRGLEVHLSVLSQIVHMHCQ